MTLATIQNHIKQIFGNDKKVKPDPKSVKQTMVNRFILGALVPLLSALFFPNPYIILGFITYLNINAILWVAMSARLIKPNWVIFIGIILDTGMGVYVSAINAADMAIVYPIYIWSILGIGFRFGNRWLFIASFISILSFGTIIYTQPYWHQNLSFSLSLLFSLFAIPAYCSILIRKLSLAKEKAETANRAKSYFLASVSHELRTPLNAIIGYGTHLSDMNLSPTQLKMVNSSVASGQYLLKLIEQLLQLGKTQTQAEDIETNDFEVTQLLLDARDMLSGHAHEKGLELLIQSEADCHGVFHGPENDIKNIILNIASNAIKFTDNGKILIRSSIKEVDGAINLIFSITDTGIGIDENVSDKIFEPFQQADESIMDRFGGTGLGLAICKQLIDKINGNISIKSEIDKGSCFNISIPLSHRVADENDDDITSLIPIISLGRAKEDILLQAKYSGHYFITHHECNTIEDIENIISQINLEDYHIALLDENMVGHIESSDPFWHIFKKSSVACIFMSENENIDIHKINMQSAFASILSPSTSFDQFRKAIKIGTSFLSKSEINNPPHADNYNISDAENQDDNHNEMMGQDDINILVVDDNRTNRMVLESILSSQNFRVDLATDGDEALEALQKTDYDIMLIDVNMPRLNGIEATKLWRQMESKEKRLPIVGVTADATDETKEKCLSAGMDERITKPVEAKNLISKVRHYCSENYKPAAVPFSHKIDNKLELPLDTAETGLIDMKRIKYLESIGDRDFIRLVIDSYIDETKEIADTLYNDNILCDVATFQFAVHAIKSSANNIGATKLSKICADYEHINPILYENEGQKYYEILTKELAKVQREILHIREEYAVDKALPFARSSGFKPS